jgi:hypothetical protein
MLLFLAAAVPPFLAVLNNTHIIQKVPKEFAQSIRTSNQNDLCIQIQLNDILQESLMQIGLNLSIIGTMQFIHVIHGQNISIFDM